MNKSPEYPSYICTDCGLKFGGRRKVPESHISTMHVGDCDICGEHRAVTEPRDFGHLKDGWQIGVSENE